MKKIIVLLLTLSLLLCMNAIVFAAEGDDGGNEPITMVGDAPETSVEPATEAETDPTEDTKEAETFAPAEQSDESETSNPAAESGTPEVTEPSDESTAPEGDVSIGDSETSEEPTDNEANSNMQPASNAEPVSDEEMLSDPPPASNATYNVTVQWTGLYFTYHQPDKGTWNPSNKTYENGGKGYWTTSADENYGTITVISNEAITVTNMFDVKLIFTQDSSFTPFLDMRFSTDSANVNTSDDHVGEMTLHFNRNSGTTQNVYVYPYYAENQMTAEAFERAENKLGTITITLTAFTAGGDPTSPEAPGME